MTDEEKAEGICVIDIFKVVHQCLEGGDKSDNEEEEKKKEAESIYDAISEAGLTRKQARCVVKGIRCAGVDVSAKGSELHTRELTADAAKELELALRTNGTVASPLPAVGSSLEFQHMTPFELAKGDLSLVLIFSWDAWPVCKGGERSFSCSTYGARVAVVRGRPNENMPCEVVNYGFTDKPGALAVFARLVAPDREQVLIDNDCGLEDILGRPRRRCAVLPQP